MNLSEISKSLLAKKQTWIVTGAAGFIGSHLVEFLLSHNQSVIGLDNLSNGRLANLQDVQASVGPTSFRNFDFHKIDISSADHVQGLKLKADIILHQAALGSVPRSIDNPLATHEANVTGSLRMLNLARELKVKRFVFASSSSVYGDCKEYPQREDRIGMPQSPYAVSKRAVELYALNFAKTYNLPVVGLRYFNVFGPRQMPEGPYAAVIPRWIIAMTEGRVPEIFGDGETSRDFCSVKNVVQANILAALCDDPEVIAQIFNITMGGNTTLNQLYQMISVEVEKLTHRPPASPIFRDFRAGDVRHSQADIGKAVRMLKYSPSTSVKEGLIETVGWYHKAVTGTILANVAGRGL